jgi:hypothetical protein
MGFLDKVKEQAAVATAVAKDAAQKGQAKLEEVQSKKSADGLLRDLGAAAYAEQTGRGTPTTASDIEKLMAALSAYEASHGPISLDLQSDAVANGSTATPPPGDAPPPPTGSTL